MTTAALRSDLLNKIDGLNVHQLKDVYGLFQNYLNGIDDTEEWCQLSQLQKEKITTGIKQADAGNLKPLAEVTTRLRRKYGLNG